MTGSDSNHPLEVLSAYLDGELSPAEAAELELHLKGCPECGLALEDLRLLSRTVAEEEPPPLPADLAGRIAGRLEPARPGKRSHPRGWFTGFFGAPLAAAAAALVAAGVLWTVWQSRQTTMMSSPTDVAKQEAVEREESAGRRFAPDEDKKAAMANVAPEAEALEEDDSTGRLDLPAKQKLSPKGPATGGGLAGQDKERSGKMGPAPSMIDGDVGAGDDQERFATSAPAPSTLDGDLRADLARPGEPLEGERSGAAGYAPSPPMEPETIPPPRVAKAAAAKPETAAPAATVTDEEAARLEQIGYVLTPDVDSGREEVTEEQKVEVRDGVAYVTPGEGAVPPPGAGAAQLSPQMREKGARRPMAVAAEAAPPDEAGRDLVLRGPGYEIRLTPSGEMTVNAGEYVCTVSPEEITPSVDREVMSEKTSDADRLELQQGTEAPGGAASPSESYGSVLAGTASGDSAARRKLLLDLVRGPYREALERKCGPLPEPVAGEPERDP